MSARLALVTTSGGTLETRYIDSNSNTYALTTYNIPAAGNHTIVVPHIIENFNNGETINLQWKWTGGGTAKICNPLFSGVPDISYLFAKVTIDTIVGGTLMNTLRG